MMIRNVCVCVCALGAGFQYHFLSCDSVLRRCASIKIWLHKSSENAQRQVAYATSHTLCDVLQDSTRRTHPF